MHTVFAPGAFKPDSLVGKPLVVYIDGERRQIGTITKAAVNEDKGALYVAAVLEEVVEAVRT